jgi:hypothetical protein
MTLRGKFCTARRTGRRGLAGATIDQLDTGRGRRVATRDKIFRIGGGIGNPDNFPLDLIYDENIRR